MIRPMPPWRVRELAAQLGLDDDADRLDHPAFGATVAFRREARLPYHRFAAAMTIARRIGLLAGHGRIGLDSGVRQALRRSAASAGASGR